MGKSINTPYVKEFDENGVLINPIIGAYICGGENRKKRREHLNVKPFFGCGKNTPLTVTKFGKFLRVRNRVYNKNKEQVITIENYILI